MSFDKIERTTDLLHKAKFYIVYGKILSYFLCLLSYFLIVEDNQLPESAINILTLLLALECDRMLS